MALSPPSMVGRVAPPVTPSLPRQLFSLSVPIIGINVLSVTMLAVDSALCGRLPNAAAALSAFGFTTQIVLLLIAATLGLIVGTVALVARAYGAKALERVDELLVQSTQLTALVGLVVGIAGAALARPLLTLLGASPDVVNVGVDYLRPLLLGTPFFCLSLLYAGVLRGVGNTRLPFLCALAANALNAVLNYGLVLGHFGLPSLGVTGSAIGTVIAQIFNVIALMWILRGGRVAGLHLRLRPVPIDRRLAVELFGVGWPAALDLLVLNGGFVIGLGLLGRVGDITVAAHGLGLRIQSLAFVPGVGIAQATAALVGQALGANDLPRARRIARVSMVLCTLMMSSLALVIVVAAHPLVGLFGVVAGTPLELAAVQWLRLLGAAMVPSGVVIALTGVLQGSGATRTSLRINIWTTFALQVPLAYVLAFPLGMGGLGVWLSVPIVYVIKAFVVYAIYRQERWAVAGIAIRRPAQVAAEA
jgi:putative MATE family efflux protein